MKILKRIFEKIFGKRKRVEVPIIVPISKLNELCQDDKLEAILNSLHPDMVPCAQCGTPTLKHKHAEVFYCRKCMLEALDGVFEEIDYEEDEGDNRPVVVTNPPAYTYLYDGNKERLRYVGFDLGLKS